MTGTEARYYRASRACHRAWVSTQPQYVIPGVLEQVDAGTDGASVSVHLFEPVGNPQADTAASPSRRARANTTGHDALPARKPCVVSQKGV